MHRYPAILLLYVVITVAGAAADISPLLARALEQMRPAKPLVAGKVITRLDVYDGKDTFLGAMDTVDAIDALRKDAPPTRRTISSRTQGSPGFTMDLSLHFEDHPGEVLDGYDTWTPKGNSYYNGAPVELYEGVAESKGENSKVLVFVDLLNALPIKAEFLIPIHSTFGNRSISATVLFGATKDGIWVPRTATIDQAGRVMFWRRHLIIRKTYEDWVKRP